MKVFKRSLFLFLLIAAGCTGVAKSVAPPASTFYQAHTRVDLVSPSKNVKPGEPVWVGLRMRMDPEWHVYWKNPGDSGLSPTIKWQLPEKFSAGEIQWPYPQTITVPPLTTYAYEGEVVLFVAIKTPKKIESSEVVIKARADWLTCKVECIPGRADLELRLPVATSDTTAVENDPAIEKAFKEMKKKWPVSLESVEVQAYEQAGDIFFEIGPISAVKPGAQVYFFPDRSDVIDHAAQQILKKDDHVYSLTIKKSSLQSKPLDSISGILVNQNGWEDVDYPQALLVDSSVEWIEPPVVEMSSLVKPIIPLESSSMTLILACLFAVLGGLILNLMPCVLPVLSLKVLHLVQHSRSPKKVLMSGLVFAVGVIISFWVLAAVLVALRSLGSAIGWGFQFQSPAFVVFIAALLFVFALNLFGLFEVGTRLTALGSASVGKNGYRSSFASGVLATIVATPCTAPFMGTALGYALSRSVFEAFLVFTFLGIGMALPIVILSRFPKLLKWVPKPGPWMITLKAILAFVLLASVIWLVWVFGLQKGTDAITTLLISFLFLSIGLYFYGRAQIATKRSMLAVYNVFIFIVAGLAFAWFAAVQPAVLSPTEKVHSGGITWQNYAPQSFQELKAGDQPVFLDFTAAWCLSCQVNDRVALSDQRVVDAFQQYDIIPVKADWTNNDPAITAALAAYGRNSIPLYVLYPGHGASPVFLPEIITPDIVIDYLRKHINQS